MGPLAPPQAFVGREAETAQLRELVRRVATGRGGLLWVEGEPGIGKTALVAMGLAEGPALGCRTMWATADEMSLHAPLHVLLDCLQVDSHEAGGRRARISQLLRGAPGPLGITEPLWSAMEELLALVDELSTIKPLIMVVDDIQWADEASLLAWHRLAEVVEQQSLLLVAVCRPVPQREAVNRLRRSVLSRDAVLVSLGPLATDEVSALVTALVGGTPDPELRHLADNAAGNPLYLCEMLDVLVRQRGAANNDGAAAPLAHSAETESRAAPGTVPTPSLSSVITRRLNFLPPEVLETLSAATLLGQEFSVTDLAGLLGAAPSTMLSPLRYAIAARVVAEQNRLLRFRHPLIHQALRDAIPSALRVALHRQAAEVLDKAGAPVERVAEQLLSCDAVDGWTSDWIAEHAATLAHRAPGIAAHLLQRFADHCAGTDQERWEVLTAALAKTLFRLGRNAEAERCAWQLLELAHDPERIAEMRWILARVLFSVGRNQQAVAVTEQALLAGPAPRWRARLQALLAMFLRAEAGDVAAAESTARAALALAEDVEDKFGIGYALCVVWLVQAVRRDFRGALASVNRALEVIGDDPEHGDLRSWALDNKIFTLQNLDRLSDAEASLRAAVAEAERGGDPSQASLHIGTAVHCFWTGRWDDARTALDSLVVEGPEVTHYGLREHGPILLYHGAAALIAGHRDDRDTVRLHLEAGRALPPVTVSDWENGDFLLAAHALSAERDGDPSSAKDLLAALLDIRPGQMTLIHQWLPDLVRLAVDLEDFALAQKACAACEAEAEAEAARSGPARAGAAAERCRGLIAGDPEQLLAVARHYEAVSRPFERAQSLEDAAVLLARKRQTAQARTRLNEAVEVYAALGAGWDIRRADTRARRYGVRRGVRGTRKRPSFGWEALSPTELKVARMVAEGMSNPEIATDLFLSRRTVQTHVSHILGKLGVHSRVEIATVALSHDARP
ncbi:AAA family ATPase [Streptomyces sp. NPDC094149]|uniref:helix-turn-helix transcriptional regulator n=1 Tax=Streptomyces sp. NPDC094149 TaxID=3155079 RepID=UPI0033168B58